MSTPLSTYTSDRNNNFNLIRFIAASLVIYSHSFALALGSGVSEPMGNAVGVTFGSLAVDIFFISSGFLITSSYLARNNLIAFTYARALRIYPALIVAMLFCVFVVGLSFTTWSTTDYLTDFQTFKYFVRNVTLFTGVEQHLPGVFEGLPFPKAVNGSIWTLPYEINMYALIALALILASFLSKKLPKVTVKYSLLVLAALGLALTIGDHFTNIGEKKNYFFHLYAMFFIGGALFIWRETVPMSSKIAAIAFVVLLASAFNKHSFFVCYCLTLPYLVLYLAYVPKGKILKFNNYGDYSYGIYIYAFPVQQMLVYFYPNIGVNTMAVSAFIIVLGFAALSWHFVEKPTLKMKNGYVVIERYWKTLTNKRGATVDNP